jgi:DNA-binding CsgD family transcriptional regulator
MNAINDLTKQERIVLTLVAEGLRTAEIAQELFVSPRTVETHLAHIFEKLDVSSRTEAAIYALRLNLTMDVEIRTNPDDMLSGNPYPKRHELGKSTRTLIGKELA